MALRGTVVCQAVPSAHAAQVRCEAPQIPHARGVTTSPAWASLSRRMTSKPRNSSACVQASTTTPLAMSTRTSRSPSTRPTGEMSSVCTEGGIAWALRSNAVLDDEDVILCPARGDGFGGGGELDVGHPVDAGGHRFRNAHDGLRLEHGAGREVEEREFRLGAAEARHAGARLRRLPVPQNAIAGRVRHRPAATQIVEQATFALAKLGRRNLVGEMHVPRAAGLGEAGEERLRALEFIER